MPDYATTLITPIEVLVVVVSIWLSIEAGVVLTWIPIIMRSESTNPDSVPLADPSLAFVFTTEGNWLLLCAHGDQLGSSGNCQSAFLRSPNVNTGFNSERC